MEFFELFRSYLSNLYRCCKINNTYRDCRKITSGVLQGSILCPSLFNILLNDIFFFLKNANLGNNADESTLYACNKTLETIIYNLRQEFSILSYWLYGNYMVLNPGKCHFVIFDIKENEKRICYCHPS